MGNIPDIRQQTDRAVMAYKELLRTYIDRRPSGTRQRIATALGTHKSFVSQITNPAYRVPLPAQHVAAIFRICHFSPEEKAAFLEAYRAAHPNQAETLDGDRIAGARVLEIEVPPFADPERQRQVADAIREMAEKMIALAGDRK
ncbi:MAG: hypothetical protein MI806_08015 [Minwuiales bacterium]|nr:hypothetical protein [Minwuiales bacterium]